MNAAIHNITWRRTSGLMQHFLALSPDDLRLRFGGCMSRQALQAYVNRIDFSRDRLFGVIDSRLRPIALGHLAIDARSGNAELGLSVARGCRRRGYGLALLERATLHASNCGARTFHLQCLGENTPLIGLARKAGFMVARTGLDADAAKPVECADTGSILRELVYEQMALVDYAWKQQISSLRPRKDFDLSPLPDVS